MFLTWTVTNDICSTYVFCFGTSGVRWVETQVMEQVGHVSSYDRELKPASHEEKEALVQEA